ncbi:MAG: phenylalanine--tRNA ligase subunit beta [Actinobacteria bacterium]|uniref:Phenylalanine--tRNA ligase beta subunit n=1 Tax=freshwater metagenome TaxID=449393 RepID=A0A6J6PZI7_9ZZZZ|nr:phenylalanine--tRNA ligase subunit beta [Actinomycetota bacterium]
MKIPISWIREFVDLPIDIPLSTLENAFVNVGFEVEEIIITGADLSGPLVVAKVESIEELSGNKKPIRYVGLNCGETDIRFVICGATNFAVGDLVVAALPGAVLPGNFAISARETYGKISNGMICSARELGLSDEHAGIIVLPNESAKPGTDAISLLEINDVIIDAAVNPDRGYALSIRGLARELAASLDLKYQDPASKVDASKYAINSDGIQVVIEDPSALSVVYIRSISDFDAKAKTPIWMSRRIEKCGMRSISLAVDITNYVMLELGQPLHAFDSTKISGSLFMRRAGESSTLKTLDGQDRKLDKEDLVVADKSNALALAGVMGGASSEVTESTTSIALEAARFEPITIAKSSRRHKLSSEASRRLERGVDPSLAQISSARAIDLMIELGGAKYVGSSKAGEARFAPIVSFDPNFVSKYLGTKVSLAEVEAKLIVVGCDVSKKSDSEWLIDPPSWRADLSLAPDLVEEVARMIGYERIPSTLPTGKSGAGLSSIQYRKRSVANYLASNGFSEVYNSPFVNPAFVADLGFVGDRAKSFKLANPMSEEFPDLRTHLLPGLLLTAVRNQGRGASDIAIFEIGSVFRNTEKLIGPGIVGIESVPDAKTKEIIYKSVPNQPLHVGAVVAGKLAGDSWHVKSSNFTWVEAIGFAKSIVESAGSVPNTVASDFAPWHPGRCAEIQVDGKPVGHAGELHPRVIAQLGLPERSCAFVVVLSAIPFLESKKSQTLLTMPPAIQDISLIVDEKVSAEQVEKALREGAGEMLESITLFDRYEKMGEGKISLAFTLVFRAEDRTLTADEVSNYREAATATAAKNCGAILRS